MNILSFAGDPQESGSQVHSSAEKRHTSEGDRLHECTRRIPGTEGVSALSPPQEDRREDRSFREVFREECIQGSAIDPSLLDENIEIIEDSGFWEPNIALDQKVSRFWVSRRPHSYRSIAFFKDHSGEYWQGKPENPREGAKYEAPVGIGNKAYIPSIPPEIQRRVEIKHGFKVPDGMDFWDFIEANPSVPLLVTEGGKKALSLLSQGDIGVSSFGCNSIFSKYEKIAGEKIRLAQPKPAQGLERFLVPGRLIVLCFDQDKKESTRKKVDFALGDAAFWLSKLGCAVSIASWDSERDGKGIDDVLSRKGGERWREILESAEPYERWAIRRKIENRMQRKPDLIIPEDKEFADCAEQIPRRGIVCFAGPRGGGKSTGMKAIADSIPLDIISLESLRAVARDKKRAGFSFLADMDRVGDRYIADGERASRISLCIPSLHKISSFNRNAGLFLDELPTLLHDLFVSDLCNKDGMRPLLIEEFEDRVRSAAFVVAGSADARDGHLRYIERLRGEKAWIAKSERKPLPYKCNFLNGSKDAAVAAAVQAIRDCPKGKAILFLSDSKRLVDQIHLILQQDESYDRWAMPITSSTSGGQDESSLLQSKGADLPGLVMAGLGAILASPSISVGFSIQENMNLIHEVWQIAGGNSISAEAIAQSPDRLRSLAPRFIWCANKGRNGSKLAQAESIPAFMREFEASRRTQQRLLASQLSIPTAAKAGKIDWRSERMRLLAELEVPRNQASRNLRITVEELMRIEGKKIAYLSLNELAGRRFKDELRDARNKLKEEHEAAILAAMDLDDSLADRLSQKEAPSPDELLALEKYYLRRFHRLEAESLSADDVAWDDGGAIRSKVRLLEMVLHPDLAEESSLKSIERSPQCPQDWRLDGVKLRLIELCGVAALIRDIAAGEVQELDLGRVGEIADFVRSHSKDFSQAFNYRSLGSLSNQQIVSVFLDACGILRAGFRQASIQGKRVRIYAICEVQRDRLLACIARRERVSSGTPLAENAIYSGGVHEHSEWDDPSILEDIREQIAILGAEEVAQWVPFSLIAKILAG